MHPLTRWRFENGRITITRFSRHKRIKTSVSYLSLIEAGKRPCPEGLATKLAAVTGIPVADFMDFKVEK